MKLFTLGLVLGSASSQYKANVRGGYQGRNDNQAGFMNEIDFGGFIQNSPAVQSRTLQVEERQDAGFSAPSFNIPFQPNFQFNEFGNFLDGNQGFSSFISGLGGQGLRSPSSFVGQTEQRFSAPQFGNTQAQIGASPFKRETEKDSSFYSQPESMHHEHHSVNEPEYHRQPQRQRPLQKLVQRYDQHEPVNQRQYTRQRQPQTDHMRHQPESFRPPSESFTSKSDQKQPDMSHDKFDTFHEAKINFYEDHDFGKSFIEQGTKRDFEVEKSLLRQEQVEIDDSSELKIESREIFDDTPDLKTIFDERPSSFNIDFEAAKFAEFLDIPREDMETVGGNKFQAPKLTETFNSPMIESEAFPFLEEVKEDRFETAQDVKPFTDFGNVNEEYRKSSEEDLKYEMPKFINFKTVPKVSTSVRKPINAPEPKLPTFSNFPTKPISTKKPTTFRKKESFKVLDKKEEKPEMPAFTYFKKRPDLNPSKPSFSSFPAKQESSKTYSTSFKSFPTNTNISKPKQPSFSNFQTKPVEISKVESLKLANEKTSSLSSSFANFNDKESSMNPTPTFESFPVQPKSQTSKVQQSKASLNHQPFTNFKAQSAKPVKEISKIPEMIPTKPPAPTKKPYLYEKKNFREPLSQVSKNSEPHQIIRIKTSPKEMKPQPKQLGFHSQHQQQRGFKPIMGTPTPGKLLIQEVQRRQEPYKPQDVVYDDSQPLLTLESVTNNQRGVFRGQSQPDNFAFNVQAGFKHNQQKTPPRIQRRLMRLPMKKPNKPDNSKQSSVQTPVFSYPPKFESVRIVRQRRLY